LSLYAVRGRGSYALLRGNVREALPLLEKVLEEPERAVVGWGRQHGALAQAYNLLGEHQRAKEICERALSAMDPKDLEFTAMNLGVEIQLALALANLGQHEEGARRLDLLLQRHADKSAVTLGSLHDARLRVAQLAEDHDGVALHTAEMKRLYGSTRLAPLLERSEQLSKSAALDARRSLPPGAGDAQSPQLVTIMHQFEHGSSAATSLPEWSLRQLAAHLQADEAYLFQCSSDGTMCAAEFGGSSGAALMDWVSDKLRERGQDGEESPTTEDDRVFGAVVLPEEAASPSHEVLRGMTVRLARS
jgi:tetratricopeptide (TPR) repeat protein